MSSKQSLRMRSPTGSFSNCNDIEARKRRARVDSTDQAALSVAVRLFLLLLVPLCPFIAEELWKRIGSPQPVSI